MRDEPDFERLSRILKAIANPLRLRILYLITKDKGKLCVTDIAEKLGVKQPSVSQSLNILRNMGLVECIRDGNKTCCSMKLDCLSYVLEMCGEVK